MQHKLLVILLAVVIAGVAWYGLSQRAPLSNPDIPLISSDGSVGGTTAPGDTTGGGGVLSNLSALQSITLDLSIFSDPAFLSLQDFSTPIQQEPVGRADPFAPLGASAAPTTQSTQSAQVFAPKH